MRDQTAHITSPSVDTITDAVLTASRLLVAVSARSIASVDESVTLPQFRLLAMLATLGPLKLTTLADRLEVNPSTATRMADRLIAAGLVSRQVNPTSRREVIAEVTTTGARMVQQVTQHRRDGIARIIAGMPVNYRRKLIEVLEMFNEAASATIM